MIPCSPDAFRLMMDGSAALADIEENGMRIDVPYLDGMIVEVTDRIRLMEVELKADSTWAVWRKVYGLNADLGSREQLGKVVFDLLGVKPGGLTKTGRYSTDEYAFDGIDIPFVKKWVSVEKLKRLRATNLIGVRREVVDGYLRPSFNLHLVITYRSSCSDPNSQNIPNRDEELAKVIRRAFIPRDKDHVLVEADFSGAEVRAAAAYHNDPTMIKYIEDEYDLHSDMAAECYQLQRLQVSKQIRGAAKGMFVFASFYGSWYRNICQNLWRAVDSEQLRLKNGSLLRDHLTSVGLVELGDHNSNNVEPGTFEHHIKKVEENFWGVRFPVYTRWKDEWWSEYLRKGWYQMKTGFVSRGIFSRNETINGPIQGTAFHWLLWTLIQLNRWLKGGRMRSKLIAQIHDSKLIDCHKSELNDVIHRMEEIVTIDLRRHWPWINVPLAIESSICPENWFDKHEFVGGV